MFGFGLNYQSKSNSKVKPEEQLRACPALYLARKPACSKRQIGDKKIRGGKTTRRRYFGEDCQRITSASKKRWKITRIHWTSSYILHISQPAQSVKLKKKIPRKDNQKTIFWRRLSKNHLSTEKRAKDNKDSPEKLTTVTSPSKLLYKDSPNKRTTIATPSKLRISAITRVLSYPKQKTDRLRGPNRKQRQWLTKKNSIELLRTDTD